MQALRSAGEPLTPEAFRHSDVPQRDNAEHLLCEVYEAYHEAWPDWPCPTMYPLEDPGGGLTTDEREELEEWWPRLAPMYEKLGRAAARPVLVATTSDPLGNEFIPWIQHAGRLWSLRAKSLQEATLRMAEQNLRVAEAWQPRNHIEVMVRWGHFVLAINTLHTAAKSKQVSLAEAREPFVDLLAEAESGWLDQFRLALRARRACTVRDVAWCRGQEPAPEDHQEWEVFVRDSRDSSRSRVYQEALQAIDHVEAQLRSVQGEPDLRSPALSAESKHPAVFYGQGFRGALLRTLAASRLARMALVLSQEATSGRTLSGDLLSYEDRFEGGLPLDPYTGQHFRWEKHERGWLLAVDAKAADPALLTVGFFCDVETDDENLLEDDLAWVIESPSPDR